MRKQTHFRITGGIFKGRFVNPPLDRQTRPMQGRLRETLFNVLRPEIDAAHVLDLFSGTGILGIESLSHGASVCTFCERHRPALAVLEKNIALLECEDSTEVLFIDLLRLQRFPTTPFSPYNLIFLDPPFRFMDNSTTRREISPLIELIVDGGLVAHDAILVYQLRKQQTPPASLHLFELEKEKEQGSVRLAFYRYCGPARDGAQKNDGLRPD